MKRRALIALLRSGGAFAAAFGLACTALRQVVPLEGVAIIREKLDWFAAHRDEFDTLFIGSSRVYHQIVPSLFDRMARERGISTHSFNLGVDRLFVPEDGYYCEQVLRLKPRRLRWVFVEVSVNRIPEQRFENPPLRSIFWRDWKRTSLVIGSYFDPLRERGWSERAHRAAAVLPDMTFHLLCYMERFVSYGRGELMLRTTLENFPGYAPQALIGPNLDGCIPLYGPMQPRMAEKYRLKKAAMALHPIERRTGERFDREDFRDIAEAVSKAGAQLVFILSPQLSEAAVIPEIKGASVLNFSDIREWPVLFEEENRIDLVHLNSAGSEIYTRAIVDKWLESMRSASRQ